MAFFSRPDIKAIAAIVRASRTSTAGAGIARMARIDN
jgi:hypothetical protein